VLGVFGFFGIVDKLMSNYLRKDHTLLYIDNYNSISLIQYLLENKINVMGYNKKKSKRKSKRN
jgi:hypothetical protein